MMEAIMEIDGTPPPPPTETQQPPPPPTDLVRGMSGPEVVALQNFLFQEGYRISEREQADKFFGDTTYDSLVDYQQKHNLVPNGIFDGKARWVLDDDHQHPNKFIVMGQVLQANGTPMTKMTVKAFDKDLRFEQLLETDSNPGPSGEYLIMYTKAKFDLFEKERADLFVQVFDTNGTLVATSPIIFNAGKVERVNFTIGENQAPSEFEKIVNQLTPLLRGIPQAELNDADISFLSSETRIAAELLTFIAESARRNIQANTIAQTTFYGLFRQKFPTDLRALLANEIPLLRAALEISSNNGIIPPLTAAQLDQIAAALQALKASIILQAGTAGEASLGDLLRTSSLTVSKQEIVAGLYVQHGGTTDTFWTAIDTSTDLTQADKDDVRFTLQVGGLTRMHIPLVSELRPPAGTAVVVAPSVIGTPLSEDASALRPFVVKDVAAWKLTLNKLKTAGKPVAPPSIPGATDDEKIDNYAVALNQYMEKSLPTPMIAARADQDSAADNPFISVKTDLKTFFTNTVNKDYEFRKTPIDVYLSEGRTDKLRGVVNAAALIAELKNIQRLFNITPRYAEIRSFRKDALHSAMAIVKLGERRFTEKYSTALGGTETAIATYRKAQQTHTMALSFYLNNAVVSNSPAPAAVRNGQNKAMTLATDSASPDLPTLFGSLDLCECDQCQSLYSPAAYFVDILKFLADGPKKETETRTPLEVLFERRPDLEHLELTCDNTTTEVPYVDLAREILEHAVKERRFEFVASGDIIAVLDTLTNKKEVPDSFPASFATKGYSLAKKASVRPEPVINGQRSWLILDSSWAFKVEYVGTGSIFAVRAWPQTSWTADELRANPEHVHSPAYAKLREAVYPWDLPLNQPVEESRVYLGHFGVKRAEVMETFLAGASAAPLTDQTIANEKLGLTQQEVDIITGVTTGGPDDNDSTTNEGAWDFWGLKDTGNDIVDQADGSSVVGTWDVVLQRVSIFLQQSGLSYRDLLELLGSYFINPAIATGRTLAIVSTDPNPSVCNLSKLEIQVADPNEGDKPGVLKAAFNRMHRFARLWRKLGWTMRDLDKAMVAFPKTDGTLDLTADFILRLSHIERLRAQFNLPVVNLLSFWATIDTGRYQDHFAEGEPAVPTLYAQLFNNKSASGQSLAEDPATLDGKLSENKSTIAAAVQVSVDDLNLLLADTNVVPNDVLDLDNLTLIYRHATFARVLRYSIRTYLATLKLIDADPFASTAKTVSVTEQAEKILVSGFNIEELDYLLRHEFSAVSNIAITDDAIAIVLSTIRDEVRKIATENEFVAASSDATAATNDPNGDLTKRKLALLNWDGALIDQLVSVLNGSFTHETGLASLPDDINIPADLRGRLTYDSTAEQLRFTGVMTADEQTRLKEAFLEPSYQAAVTALFQAPRNMIGRQMARFSVPRFTTPLASMPGGVVIPSAIKSKIFYDNVTQKLNFLGIMTEAERKALIDAEPKVPSTPPAPATEYETAIQNLFDAGGVAPTGTDVFITQDDVDTTMMIDTATAASRFLVVLQKLLPHLRTTLSERIVVQRIGEFLQFDSKTANDMLRTWVKSPAPTSTAMAIDELLAPSFAESSPNIGVTRSVFGTQFDTITRLYKISVVGVKFRLSGQQFQWLFEYRPDNNWLDLNALPLVPTASADTIYPLWSRTADLIQLSESLPNGEALLTDIFTTAHTATPQLDDLLDKLSNGAGWKLDNLQALSTGFGLDEGAFKDEVALRRLQSAFATLNLIGASADQCLNWASATTEQDETKSAQDIKSLVRAKLDNTQWLEVAKNLNDPLRERQRAALVSYLMPKRNARNGNELYDDFLIDVEMSPCMMTTRIKQAISSVQLFIQRSLMNLEEDVFMTSKEAREWAQWRKQYRMWEANRKILLYPENWIEPELRDGKSQFFEQMQDELLQTDVTKDSAETAFVHYLEKLQEVGRLEIVGMYHETEAATDKTSAVNVMHVIGRSSSAPHVHYYRRQIDSASWTPWEKVEADIQGNHVIPAIWNRSLYLFWPIFTIKQEDKPFTMPATGATITPGAKKLEIQFAWTEYKNGKWSAKKLTAPFMTKVKHPESTLTEDFKLFSFKTRTQSPDGKRQLFIDCYGPLEIVSTIDSPSTETHLFTLGVPSVRTVYATVKGVAIQPAEAKKLQIIVRDELGNKINTIPFGDSGSVIVRNTISVRRKYSISSAAYTVQDTQWSGSELICKSEGTSTSVLGGNGHSLNGLFTGTETPTLSLLVGTETVIAPTALPGGRIICENTPDTICTVDLAAVQTGPNGSTATTSTTDSMQAIVTFNFDEGQQSLSPLENSTPIPSIEPIVGTQFQNMMMVEYNNLSEGLGQPKLLQPTHGKFRLLGMHQTYTARDIGRPFFFQDDLHAYYVVDANGKARFNPFYHAYVSRFSRSLNRFGIDGLLDLANQRLNDDDAPVFSTYSPDSDRVDLGANMPREDVDFEYDGAYSTYNWELFFHAPFMIATQLSKNQRFEEAQKWFHYIFDPTTTDSPENPDDPGSERFWRVQPFYNEALHPTHSLAELFEDDTLATQIREWQANPFNPHVIARLRKVAYMKAVVMRYIDNLIAWGDQLFRRDTIESINEATQLYILAAQILGRRPEQIPPRAKAKVQTYRTLDDNEALNNLANATVEIEGLLPPVTAAVSDSNGDVVFEGEGEESINVVPTMPFFAIPSNDKLLGYWDTVGDRLFKIRHCMNIDGGVRTLPIFEPPIDPGLLVRAAAAGIDIASALSDINVALPHYRFSVMSQKAGELCGEVKALGSALLSALEKRDAEAMALLRSTHEIKVLKAVRTVKEKQLAEAIEARIGLDRTKELTTMRRDYYRDIAFMNQWEKTQLALSTEALFLQEMEVGARNLASFLHLIPNLKTALPSSMGLTYGGENIGNAISAFGDSLSRTSGLLNSRASMAATMGGHQRRFDDWKLQERLANKELEQIERQIAAADIRKAIAEKELSNHDLQVQNTREVDEFMRSKFTNRELYDWMVGQISGIYFQSYQLAYDVAKRAERAYRYELGLRDSNFIQFGYWDSLKKGLLAGERLSYDLKHMEVTYLEKNQREYEIVKHISLQSIDPVSLARLKQTGSCFVTLPETLFDVDYAGHYMRRIKSVGITVPCVAGPYTGVNCTLTLQGSSIRHCNTLSKDGGYARQADDPRFADNAGANQSIATSGAQNDSGLFEPNLRDERYLPFEGQGAVSTWRIELPQNFKTFDYNTISDVVLHMRYTARDGGADLRTKAQEELQNALNDFARSEGKQGLTQMFSLRHEFGTEWARFLSTVSGSTRTVTMPLTRERFPFLFQGRNITINEIELFVKVKPGVDGHTKDTLMLKLGAGDTASGNTLTLDEWNGLVRGAKSFSNEPGAFTLNAWRHVGTEDKPVEANAIQDILVVCRYTI
jgi:Tc toxin complex TcA C-terminal TcB-binding domain/ABC toxin N-terminal region/Neuraminidase-like domain/Putative peptidoglycan binding domain/Salmonella virulence plasmid 28.1kDa A protein